MPGVCRIGDTGAGICPNHPTDENYTTIFITGEGNVLSNDIETCTIGAIGASTCGHATIAISGSLTSLANDKGIHRQDDTGSNYGPYVALTSSNNVTSE